MPKKLTQEQVATEFAAHGCVLLDIYQGNMKSMNYICRCGAKAKTSLVGFRRSAGCYQCSEASGGRRSLFEEVKAAFEQAGCVLLETEYVNNLTPMKYRCECGNESSIRYGDFKEGVRCQNCKGLDARERLRKKDVDLAAFCESKGCELIEAWLENGRTRIQFVCKCGSPWEAYWSNFSRFPNCKKCGADKIRGDKCWMWNPDRAWIQRGWANLLVAGRVGCRTVLSCSGCERDRSN